MILGYLWLARVLGGSPTHSETCRRGRDPCHRRCIRGYRWFRCICHAHGERLRGTPPVLRGGFHLHDIFVITRRVGGTGAREICRIFIVRRGERQDTTGGNRELGSIHAALSICPRDSERHRGIRDICRPYCRHQCRILRHSIRRTHPAELRPQHRSFVRRARARVRPGARALVVFR